MGAQGMETSMRGPCHSWQCPSGSSCPDFLTVTTREPSRAAKQRSRWVLRVQIVQTSKPKDGHVCELGCSDSEPLGKQGGQKPKIGLPGLLSTELSSLLHSLHGTP